MVSGSSIGGLLTPLVVLSAGTCVVICFLLLTPCFSSQLFRSGSGGFLGFFFFFGLFVFSVHNFPRLHITQLFLVLYGLSVGFPGDSVVKNLPAMQETRVRSLGQEDPLEEGIAL